MWARSRSLAVGSGIYLRLNEAWQSSQVARKSSEATRTLIGLGVHSHSQSRMRDPEPLPREVPPREPTPAEHGRGLVGRVGIAKVRNSGRPSPICCASSCTARRILGSIIARWYT